MKFEKFDWKSLVRSVAPALGTALGTPLAGAAIKVLTTTLLGKEEAPEQELAQILETASPDTLLKLKEADHDFAIRMKELGVDLERIAAEDRHSARDMQKVAGSLAVPLIAGFTVAGFFLVAGYMLTGRLLIDSTLAGFVLGQVSAKTEQVYNFYFGSSVGSKEKTQILSKSDRSL